MIFLKRNVTIFQTKEFLNIGILPFDSFIKVKNNRSNLLLLKKLIREGIDINSFLKSELAHLPDECLCDNNQTSDRVDLFFDYKEIKLTAEVKNSKILVIGAGANGSLISYMLAQVGFKNVFIIDSDEVEETDIKRNIFFNREYLNRKKVNAIENKVKENFNEKRVTGIDDLISSEEKLSFYIKSIKPRLIIKAADFESSFRDIFNRLAFKNNVSFFDFSYSYDMIKIGPMYIPNITCCDNSLNELMKDYYGKGFDFSNLKRLFENELYHPSISYVINICVSLSFKEIIYFLTGEYEKCSTLGTLVQFSTENLATNSYKLECKPDCEICK